MHLVTCVFQYMLFVISVTSLCQSIKNPVGYYWRDYLGEIPSDAVAGGMNRADKPTYIGQVYIKGVELLPATIRRNTLNATTSAHNKEIYANKNIKILCSNEIDKLTWIATKSNELHLLSNCNLVIGGSEVDHTLYIGRVNHGGRTIIGKVFSRRKGFNGLWIPYNGHEINFKTFEVLAFNCSYDIDVRLGMK